MLTAHKTVKISDFGLAVRVSGQDAEYWSRQEVPTPYKWSAPESLRDAVYSARSDVWSLGVLLWEMFSLAEDPFTEVTSPSDLLSLLDSGSRLPEVSRAPRAVSSLMRSCWSRDQLLRPSARDISDTLTSVSRSPQTLPEIHKVENIGHYKIPNQIVPSRSFYWTHYKVLKGDPVTVTKNISDNLVNDNNDNDNVGSCNVEV